jgi:hypothetical protein
MPRALLMTLEPTLLGWTKRLSPLPLWTALADRCATGLQDHGARLRQPARPDPLPAALDLALARC